MIRSINQFLKKYLPNLYKKKKMKRDKKQGLWTWRIKEREGND